VKKSTKQSKNGEKVGKKPITGEKADFKITQNNAKLRKTRA